MIDFEKEAQVLLRQLNKMPPHRGLDRILAIKQCLERIYQAGQRTRIGIRKPTP